MMRGKHYFYKLTVSGKGLFPTDMLRYDQCFPCSERDSASIDDPHRYGDMSGEIRTVELCASNVNPNWQPTTGRWNSFNWQVVSWEQV